MAETYEIHLTDPQTPSFKIRAFTSNGPIFPISTDLNSTATFASTSLVIYGKGHPNYGERIEENVVHIMENFAGGTPPVNPVIGQTWFGRNTIVRKGTTPAFTFYEWIPNISDLINGGDWVLLTNVTIDTVDPALSGTPVDGSYWYNSTFDVMYYRINNITHPMSPIWIQREYDQYGNNVPDASAPPRQYMRVYDGVRWADTRLVTTSGTIFEPINQLNGNLWIDSDTYHFNYYVNGAFNEVATTVDLVSATDLKINRAGDIMDNPAGTPGVPGVGPGAGGIGLDMNDTPLANILGLNMTGNVDIGNNDITNTNLITMTVAGPGIDMSNTPIAQVGGIVMTGDIDMGGAGNTNNILNLTSLTMAGDINMIGTYNINNVNNIILTNPTSSISGATLLTMAGDIDMVNNNIINASNITSTAINVGSTTVTGNITMTGPASSISGVVDLTMAGEIDMTNYRIINLLDPLNIQDAATKNYVDNEIGTIPLPSATPLSGLFDVANSVSPGNGSYIRGDGSAWQESNGILFGDISDSIITVTELNYLTGATSSIQNQLNGKLNLSGGTITGTGKILINLPTVVPASNELITEGYLAGQISDVIDQDQHLTSAVYVSGTHTLTLGVGTTLIPDTTLNIVDMSHQHISSDINHTTLAPLYRDILPVGVYPNTTVDEAIETAITNLHQRLEYYETLSGRELFTATAGQTQFAFTDDEYITGSNKLSVYVNGIKQYANERARQTIYMITGSQISASSPHGLAISTYDFNIAVDGGAIQPITLTVDGTAASATIQAIIDTINLNLVGGSAAWMGTSTSIFVFSNGTGLGSAIDITPGGATDLFTALAAVTIPVFANNPGDIFPPAPGPITTITSNSHYAETDDLFAPVLFGAGSSSIEFNVGLNIGDVVEMIAEPAFLV